MSNRKFIFIILFCCPFFLTGQRIDNTLPKEISKNFLGSWLNKDGVPELIITQDYLVFQNQIWYHTKIRTHSNKIESNNDILEINCSNYYTNTTIRVFSVDKSNIYFERNLSSPSVHLIKDKNLHANKINQSYQAKWHSKKNVVVLKENTLLFNGQSFILDYYVPHNNGCYFIFYYNSLYYLFKIDSEINNKLLYGYLPNEITFNKETFFQKYYAILIAMGVVALSVLIYILFKWKISINQKKESAKRIFAEMQLKSIRSQMNPHFLFNALSAIQNLIIKGESEKANHYLIAFSKLMRLTLDKSEKGLVPLADEIESIKKYLELENLRFQFEFKIAIDASLNIYEIEIPGMLIQPFIENAIIHGINEIEGEKEVTVEIKKQENYLVCIISDNGIGIQASKTKSKTNINRDRYGLKLAQDRIDLINKSHKTNAKIEIIDKQENGSNTGTIIKIFTPLNY